MKTRNIILTILAAVLIAVPGSTLAQSGPGYGPGGSGYGPPGGQTRGSAGGEGEGILRSFEHALPQLAERLELSDEQVAQIQAILDKARPEIEKYAELRRKRREAYRAANNDPTVFDEVAFRSHAAYQDADQVELMVVVGTAKAEIFQVLTPEQLEHFEEMRADSGKRSFRRGGGRRSTD
ncbi:MAG: Spy/CpxP family protein refolding chaperone [Acidobacteria bacterium]|nr:Spy/CpxP family protein refolding chaperone [Candidatus Sulfomarinibacter sp. MAG AM1]